MKYATHQKQCMNILNYIFKGHKNLLKCSFIILVLQGFLWKYRNVGVSPCAYPSVNRATTGGLPLQKSTKIIEEP